MESKRDRPFQCGYSMFCWGAEAILLYNTDVVMAVTLREDKD